jgi:hypothetical protein
MPPEIVLVRDDHYKSEVLNKTLVSITSTNGEECKNIASDNGKCEFVEDDDFFLTLAIVIII